MFSFETYLPISGANDRGRGLTQEPLVSHAHPWPHLSLYPESLAAQECEVPWPTVLSSASLAASTLTPGILVAQEYEVPWPTVLEQRTGQQSKRRWYIMLKSVPDHVEKSFTESLSYLVDTYAPKLRKQLAQSAA